MLPVNQHVTYSAQAVFREIWYIAVSQGSVILGFSAVFITSYRRITEYVKTLVFVTCVVIKSSN